MKKILIGLSILVVAIVLVGCGSGSSGENTGDEGKTEKVTYQSILDKYAAKMKEKTPQLVNEYKEEGAGKDESDQAEICTKKIQILADIDVDGMGKMAELMTDNGDSYDTYEKWATKLSDKYMQYASKITDVYSNAATSSLAESMAPSVEQ